MSDAEYSVRFSEDEQEDPIPRKSFPKKKPTKLGRSLPSLYKSKYAPQPVPGARPRNPRKPEEIPKFTQAGETMFFELKQVKSELANARQENKTLKEENRTLKRVQVLSERAMRKLNHEQEDIPRVIDTLREDIRSTKNTLRQTQEKLKISEKQNRDLHELWVRTKTRAEKLAQLLKASNVDLQVVLTNKVEELEQSVAEYEERCDELEGEVQKLERENARLRKLAGNSDDEGNPSPRSQKIKMRAKTPKRAPVKKQPVTSSPLASGPIQIATRPEPSTSPVPHESQRETSVNPSHAATPSATPEPSVAVKSKPDITPLPQNNMLKPTLKAKK